MEQKNALFFRQVVLSGDFVPHLAHGAVVSRPLRPQRSHGNTSNLAARGSLSFQLMLRRGGESLASEFVRSAITVEVLTAKGLPPSGPALEPGIRYVGGTGAVIVDSDSCCWQTSSLRLSARCLLNGTETAVRGVSAEWVHKYVLSVHRPCSCSSRGVLLVGCRGKSST